MRSLAVTMSLCLGLVGCGLRFEGPQGSISPRILRNVPGQCVATCYPDGHCEPGCSSGGPQPTSSGPSSINWIAVISGVCIIIGVVYLVTVMANQSDCQYGGFNC